MQPYRINVPDHTLQVIRDRVRNYRWDAFVAPDGAGDWRHGPPPIWLREFCAYWTDQFDWHAQERRMNELPHFLAEVNGIDLHFVHERGSGNSPRPLLLAHGWPYSFHSYTELIERLAHPERFGGREEDAFSVVVPSMPGYDFSSRPVSPIGPKRIAPMFNRLMTEVLGYDRYFVHGGDWGSAIAEMLSFQFPETVAGIHITMLSVRHHGAPPRSNEVPADASKEERDFASVEASLWKGESAYARIQATRPLKLSAGMVDSPVGVAAWIVEAFHAWSDRRDRPFGEIFSRDQLLTEIMLYLVTDAFGPASWIYVAEGEEQYQTLPPGGRIEVPVGVAAYPDPVFPMPPRSVAERSHNIVRFSQMDYGGHFPFYEAPDGLLADLFEFVQEVGSLKG
jgi:pimeloyl-ACP methyl ester carboxylesterase